MFEKFYEMHTTPFSRSIPSNSTYVTSDSEEILMRLNYVAQRQLFAVMTGDCGTGKTTLIRKFSESIDSNRFKMLYISDSKLNPKIFYRSLLEQLGFESRLYRGDAKRLLHKEIEIMKAVHRIDFITVVDEAHLLSREMLEEIRFLLNVKMDSTSPMALLLIGQSELWDKLHLQSYTAIRQRIDIQSKLNQYDRAQCEAYINHHMNHAGCDREIFTDVAIDEIYKYTNGSARLINKLCTSCLIYGSQAKKRLIDDHIVRLLIEWELP